jgi:hypothetical protein
MNSISLSGQDIEEQQKIDSFVKGLRSLWYRMDALHDWRRLMVARRCAELDFERGKPIPLDEFLLKAQRVDRDAIKDVSIRKLFAFFEVPDAYVLTDLSQTARMN